MAAAELRVPAATRLGPVKWRAHEHQGVGRVLTVGFSGEERGRGVLSTCGVVGGTSAARFVVDPARGGSGKARVASNGFATSCRS